VPLIVYDPRQTVGRGQVVSPMALNIDIGATILDFAGIETPEVYNGRSLRPIIDGDKPMDWRIETLAEFFSGHGSIPNWEGIRGDRYVYAYYYDEDYEFLHDLKSDPDQLINYANDPEYKQILEEMRNKSLKATRSLGERFRHTPKKKKR